MANTPIAPERRERAVMLLMPPYNWSLRQVPDDIGAGISTVHQRRKQPELEGLISVCNREADIGQYLVYKLSQGQRFVVRAAQNHRLASDEGNCSTCRRR